MTVIRQHPQAPQPPTKVLSARSLYFSLFDATGGKAAQADSALFLNQQLQAHRRPHPPLPSQPQALEAWMLAQHEAVGQQYQDYLTARKAGASRWYFSGKAHALYFLRAVAPTKLVDGAWLYGLTRHWRDQRLSSLLQTYLEELGNGVAAQNHVLLYRQLLEGNACEDWRALPDAFFTQGAVQLALAARPETFLPEIIGFNLGYEQLPLHLLITAYELRELNIDPYYFTLHCTIDNAHTGHARAAVNAVFAAMPAFGSTQAYMERVAAGVSLSNAGLGTLAVIHHFDLMAEVVRILRSKAQLGQYMHTHHCQIEGKPLNEWLAEPDQMARLLYVLQKTGWIRRHQDPTQSRFWQIITGEKAPMFGVFNGYEQQVIYDWIAGDMLESLPREQRLGPPWQMRASSPALDSAAIAQGNVYDFRSGRRLGVASEENDFDCEQRALERYVHALPPYKRLDFLVDWLSPAKHPTAPGLWATRYFKQALQQQAFAP